MPVFIGNGTCLSPPRGRMVTWREFEARTGETLLRWRWHVRWWVENSSTWMVRIRFAFGEMGHLVESGVQCSSKRLPRPVDFPFPSYLVPGPSDVVGACSGLGLDMSECAIGCGGGWKVGVGCAELILSRGCRLHGFFSVSNRSGDGVWVFFEESVWVCGWSWTRSVAGLLG